MANVIRHKRGTSDPAAGDFSQTAELLVNTTDGGLFTKTDGGDVVEVGKDVPTSGSSDALTISHSTDTDITMSLYCESQTAKIADTFSDTTTDKKYIYFSNPNGSNDPGYILHETSNSETNEGVLHLVPSDDNAEIDYVSIHGTNDPDRLKLHTSGLIETASGDLEFRSGSGTIKTPDDIQLESSANLVFYDTNGTFPTAAGAFKWTLNNDSASIYAQQPASDYIDFFFKITDNAGSTDRFVFWIDDYRGSTYDKYPAQFDGSAQYLSVPVDGSGNKDLSNARFKVPFSGDVVIDGSKVWHAGNDGSGSGLDADTVDGIQSSNIVYGSNGAAVNSLSTTQNVYELGQYKSGFWDVNGASWTPDTGWWWGATFAHSSNGSNYNYSGQLAFKNGSGGNGLYARTISAGTASSWSKLWSSGNDGPGSGLDADTLDGQQGSYYAPLASPTFTGTPAAPTASAGTNTTQVATTAFVQTAVANVVDSAPAALDTLNELAAALGDDANFSTTVTNSIAEKLPKAGGTMTGNITLGTNYIYGDITSAYLRVGSQAEFRTVRNITIVADDDDSSTTEALTLGAGQNSLVVTSHAGSTDNNKLTYNGNIVWHAGNDGTGSGLDADTVDGLHATSFIRSNTQDSVTGPIEFTSGTLQTYDPTSGTSGSDTATDVAIALGDGHRIVGHVSGYIRSLLQWDNGGDITIGQGGTSLIGGINLVSGSSQTNVKVNGNRILTTADEGSGNGIDADTVDGVHASSFFQANNALSATTGAFSGDVTMSGTGALKVANGTTAQRPTPATGQIRYNTTLGALESYVQGVWQVIANTALDYGLITSASDTTFDYGALS